MAVLDMFNKILVKVFISDIYSGYGPGFPKTQSFHVCPFLTLSVRNGPSVSFETNVLRNDVIDRLKDGVMAIEIDR